MRSPEMDAPSEALRAHVHAWVLARVPPASRVLLIEQTPALAAALSARDCDLLALAPDARGAPPPEGLHPLERLAPTHVVLPVEASWPLAEWLGWLRREAPGAEVLLGFWNAGSAAGLLATLLGRSSGRAGPSDVEVAGLLSARGFEVRRREAVRAQAGTTGLARETEDSLQALLTQLSASAEADLVLYAVAPRAVTEPDGPRFEPGLLSVVVDAASQGPGLLDETLFSLACQDHPSLEVLLVHGEVPARVPAGLALRHVEGEGPEVWREALARARGQYVAFLDAGSVVYPRHYVRLIEALHAGPAAWALARAFRATCRPGTPGQLPYIESKRPFPLGERLDLAQFLREPELLQALVVDRTRVGPLALEPHAPGPLPLRLWALFAPVFLAEGLATCEVRSFSPAPPATAAPGAEPRMLVPLGALTEALTRAQAEGALSRGLAHRMVDEVTTGLRERLPWLHGALRSAVRGRR